MQHNQMDSKDDKSLEELMVDKKSSEMVKILLAYKHLSRPSHIRCETF
jgi:hypothetical protein